MSGAPPDFSALLWPSAYTFHMDEHHCSFYKIFWNYTLLKVYLKLFIDLQDGRDCWGAESERERRREEMVDEKEGSRLGGGKIALNISPTRQFFCLWDLAVGAN